MGLAPGSRVGVYEVVGKLGAGGMGEVYRARDTTLDRDVALKILPDSFATDPDRLMRFEREAKALASLNHPHIAQIHGFEQSAGASALVMELVEGEDLAERLARGAMPLDEAVPIARQIAEALEAAHEVGIIHRDLKPANVKLRPDGAVKVLDFGLAKPMPASAASDPAAVHGPTITTPAMTLHGVILGTAAYMSPEQAKGRAVDRRADIWAFGCVLYEMLAGQRAFEGEDVSDTMAAILRGEPDWKALPALPPALDHLLRRCLERDLRRRVPSMATVRFVLDASAVNDGISRGAAPVNDTKGRVPRLAIAALSLTVIVLAGLLVAMQRPADAPAAVVRFELPMPDGQVMSTARRILDISPDGQAVAYVTDQQLFVRRLSEFDPVQIQVGAAGSISSPTFSPDGAWLAFHSAADDAVKRISMQGGAPLRVCATATPLSIRWDEFGILLGMGSEGVHRCDPSGGNAEQVLRAPDGELITSPQFLPGGEALLFTAGKVAEAANVRWDRSEVVVHSLNTGSRHTVVESASDARYVPATGHLLYRSAGMLFAVPFDTATLRAAGDAVPVVEGVRRGTLGLTHMALSDSGVLIYIPGALGTNSNQRDLVVGDRGGTIMRLAVPAGPYVHVRVSPDATRLAIGTDDGKVASVWRWALDGKTAMQRLTIDGINRFPIWSPDGQWIAYSSELGGKSGIVRQRADGSSRVEWLTTAAAGELHIPESWSSDGRHLAYAVRRVAPAGQNFSLRIFSFADAKTTALDLESVQPFGAVFSPNGRWLAYSYSPGDDVNDSNRGVFVQPFPPTGARFQVPRQLVDFHPMWSRDGGELVFVASATARVMASVGVSGTTSLTFGAPARFPATVAGDRLSPEPRVFDLLPDGRIVGAIAPSEVGRTASPDLRVVLNWFEDLKQRVPTK
jgi:eukaryotic-like serine/threonine-protein kinase